MDERTNEAGHEELDMNSAHICTTWSHRPAMFRLDCDNDEMTISLLRLSPACPCHLSLWIKSGCLHVEEAAVSCCSEVCFFLIIFMRVQAGGYLIPNLLLLFGSWQSSFKCVYLRPFFCQFHQYFNSMNTIPIIHMKLLFGQHSLQVKLGIGIWRSLS